jgi:hypothetical protein
MLRRCSMAVNLGKGWNTCQRWAGDRQLDQVPVRISGAGSQGTKLEPYENCPWQLSEAQLSAEMKSYGPKVAELPVQDFLRYSVMYMVSQVMSEVDTGDGEGGSEEEVAGSRSIEMLDLGREIANLIRLHEEPPAAS